MTSSYDLIHGGNIGIPGVSLVLQKRTALSAQAIITAPGTSAVFDPAALDESLLFEAAKNRIERADPEMQPTARSRLDQLADFVTMPVAFLEKGENQKLRTAFFQFP